MLNTIEQDNFRRKTVVLAFLNKEFSFLKEYLPLITTEKMNELYVHLPQGNIAECIYQQKMSLKQYISLYNTSEEAMERRIKKSIETISKDLTDIIDICMQRGENAPLRKSYCLTRTTQKDNPDYLRLFLLGVDTLPVIWRCLDAGLIITDQITEKVLFKLKQLDTSLMNYQQVAQLIRAIYADLDYKSFAKPEYSASRMQMLVELQLQGHSICSCTSLKIPLSALVGRVYDCQSTSNQGIENLTEVKKRRKNLSDTVANFYPYDSFDSNPFSKMNKEHGEYIKGCRMTC